MVSMHSIKSLLVIFLVSSLIFSCTTANKKADDESLAPPLPSSASIKKIDVVGKNRQPVFISENEISFISYDRKSHKKGQLYTYNFADNTEKRITYQVGDVTNGSYSKSTNEFFYSSSLDETRNLSQILTSYDEKAEAEKSPVLPPIPYAFLPQEIYVSNLEGDNIYRLTNFSGFDGQPMINEKKKQIIFSRQTQNNFQLYRASLTDTDKVTKITFGKEDNNFNPVFNPKGEKVVWTESNSDYSVNKLNISDWSFKKVKPLFESEGMHWSTTWHPKGEWLVFSSNKPGSAGFDLYTIKKDGTCLKPLTNTAGDDYFPSFSPEGNKIVFTSTREGEEQLYTMDFEAPDCEAVEKQEVSYQF